MEHCVYIKNQNYVHVLLKVVFILEFISNLLIYYYYIKILEALATDRDVRHNIFSTVALKFLTVPWQVHCT